MSQQIYLELMDHLTWSKEDSPKQDDWGRVVDLSLRGSPCHKWHFLNITTRGVPQLFHTIPVFPLALSSSLLPSFPVGSQRSLMFVTGHDRWKPLSPRGSEALLNWKLQMKSVGFKFISYYARWPLAAADKNERMLAVIQFSTLSTPLTSFTVRQPTHRKWKW